MTVRPTWLDRELASPSRTTLANTGFGREVTEAMERRRQSLVNMGHAVRFEDGRIRVSKDFVANLERTEVTGVGKAMAAERGLTFTAAKTGEYVSGTLVGSAQLASGRFATIDDGIGFQLVPWQPVFDKRIGQHISSISPAQCALLVASNGVWEGNGGWGYECPQHRYLLIAMGPDRRHSVKARALRAPINPSVSKGRTEVEPSCSASVSGGPDRRRNRTARRLQHRRLQQHRSLLGLEPVDHLAASGVGWHLVQFVRTPGPDGRSVFTARTPDVPQVCDAAAALSSPPAKSLVTPMVSLTVQSAAQGEHPVVGVVQHFGSPIAGVRVTRATVARLSGRSLFWRHARLGFDPSQRELPACCWRLLVVTTKWQG
jgi:hypothetical protein